MNDKTLRILEIIIYISIVIPLIYITLILPVNMIQTAGYFCIGFGIGRLARYCIRDFRIRIKSYFK